MVLGITLTVLFTGLISGLIYIGLRQRFELEVPARPWPKPVELPPVLHRLRLIRWSLLPFWIGLAILQQWVPWLRWPSIALGGAYFTLAVAGIVIGLRVGIRARRRRTRRWLWGLS